MDALIGGGEDRVSFEDVDQQFHLKIRALIPLCMPPIFRQWEKMLQISTMRDEGIVPIMFRLHFETYPNPLAFTGKLATHHQVRLARCITPAGAGQEADERLLLDMQIDVEGAEIGSGQMALGGANSTGRMVPAGLMRGVHVITRPMAPPSGRRVVEVPRQLREMKEHAWQGPYPSMEDMLEIPAGFTPANTGTWAEQPSVWGLSNTDINQHVNVLEYIAHLENHFSRMLHGAGLPVDRHRTAVADFHFRKPSFQGDAHVIRAQLWVSGNRTLMLGGFHLVSPSGEVDTRATVFGRLEGVIAPEGERHH